MNNENTMKPTSKKLKHDWSHFDAMSEDARHTAALADPDARPLTPDDFKRMKRTPQVKIIRRALALSQEEFSSRFHIPLGTLRDWEQGRKEPDAAARSYLVVIGRNPEAVLEAHGVAQIVEAAQYLKDVNYPIKLIRDMHHFENRTVTYASIINYFEKQHSIHQNNRLFGLRLLYVKKRLEKSNADLNLITKEALAKYPQRA